MLGMIFEKDIFKVLNNALKFMVMIENIRYGKGRNKNTVKQENP